VVPEINADLLPPRDRPAIIANPNCSTIQLVVALNPLAKKFGLKAVRVASYQSVSGAGRNGLEELFTTTRQALEGEDVETSATFPQPIAFNCVPQIGGIGADGFCTEEVKIMKETTKILRLDFPVSAFTVRVPTMNGHAEAAWVTLSTAVEKPAQIETCLADAPGLKVLRANDKPAYPTQKLASGTDPVYVGRIHRDLHDPHTWLMWIVADNLKKGAALNGIQIAERIFDIKSPA
jgi:aspartate-semialdehyde dehydrogenase